MHTHKKFSFFHVYGVCVCMYPQPRVDVCLSGSGPGNYIYDAWTEPEPRLV